ncbi:unnamed protein product [Ilex paraguariensis]|uniref:Dirigent protein n=1 Tax=Ilex paraguariensis TaxID=185542 RepID=A0ABC8S8W2_9AQUA
MRRLYLFLILSSMVLAMPAAVYRSNRVESQWSSKEIGRVQGLYAAASLEDVALSCVLNFIFTEGEYNGSSLSLLGNNPFRLQVREMPIVGGSGVFRLARGVATFTTYFCEVPPENVPPKNVTVEVNIVAMHC